jgi:hypothetical protein
MDYIQMVLDNEQWFGTMTNSKIREKLEEKLKLQQEDVSEPSVDPVTVDWDKDAKWEVASPEDIQELVGSKKKP